MAYAADQGQALDSHTCVSLSASKHWALCPEKHASSMLISSCPVRFRWHDSSAGEPNPFLSLLREVISRTVKLVAKWQAVGFVHGVLNTDNMSILGETIDYGPFGFLERFDPNFTPNTTDFSGRRYAFRTQPGAVQWNLMALATSFVTEELCEKVSRTWQERKIKLHTIRHRNRSP